METNGLGFAFLTPRINSIYEIIIKDDMIRFTSGLNHPLGNWIMKVRFNAQNVENRITEAMKFFREKELAVMWWITPSSTPENLLCFLENDGLQVTKKGTPRMAYDLRDLTDIQLEKAVNRSQIKVTKVASDHSLKLWGKVFQEGFSLPETITEMFQNMAKLYESSYLDNYIAIFKEQPVAISSVLYYGGIVGINSIVTLPDFRGLGIGTAITLAPLLDAKKNGYEIAWLESSEIGLNIYKRIGFQEYCKMYRCFYTPEGN